MITADFGLPGAVWNRAKGIYQTGVQRLDRMHTPGQRYESREREHLLLTTDLDLRTGVSVDDVLQMIAAPPESRLCAQVKVNNLTRQGLQRMFKQIQNTPREETLRRFATEFEHAHSVETRYPGRNTVTPHHVQVALEEATTARVLQQAEELSVY
jgi:hypothetical protein